MFTLLLSQARQSINPKSCDRCYFKKQGGEKLRKEVCVQSHADSGMQTYLYSSGVLRDVRLQKHSTHRGDIGQILVRAGDSTEI